MFPEVYANLIAVWLKVGRRFFFNLRGKEDEEREREGRGKEESDEI